MIFSHTLRDSTCACKAKLSGHPLALATPPKITFRPSKDNAGRREKYDKQTIELNILYRFRRMLAKRINGENQNIIGDCYIEMIEQIMKEG